jgi:cation diffusion facilitator family transporter
MRNLEERLLLISIFVLISIGVIEVAVGYMALSIALLADGAHSFADSIVSVLVLAGIRLAKRGPDGKFHHGYGRAESLFGLIASMVVVATGAIILYESYLAFFINDQIVYPEMAIGIAVFAGVLSTVIALFKLRLAKKAASPALKVDAYNSLKDGSASFVVLVALVLASLGFHYFDAIGGVVISIMILAVAYVSIKESSIVLMDGCVCGDVFEAIYGTAEAVPGVKRLRNLKLRQIGRGIVVEAAVELDGGLSVVQAGEITSAIKKSIMDKNPDISKIILEIEASGAKGG